MPMRCHADACPCAGSHAVGLHACVCAVAEQPVPAKSRPNPPNHAAASRPRAKQLSGVLPRRAAPWPRRQELVDCVPNPKKCGGTGGCDGATQPMGFEYVAQYGIATEASYPYTATTDKCKKFTAVANVSGAVRIPKNNYSVGAPCEPAPWPAPAWLWARARARACVPRG